MAEETTTPLVLIRGCDYSIPLTLDVDGTPIDITGSTVRFQATKSANDPENRAIIDVEQTSHTNPTLGQTTIEIPKEDITEIGKFVYRLWYTDATGKVSKTLFGELKIEY